jgi:glucose 1-dehydrogenase
MLERHLQKGLRVLVTAGAAGIGREIVRALVEDDARVHICDVDTAALDDARREHAVTTSVTDVAEVEQVERLFTDVRTYLGGLDVLVNNAGIQISRPTEELSSADFDRVLAVNLRGAFMCAREAIRHLLAEEKGGSIVNVSSVHQLIPKPNYLGYSTSKGGMMNLTRTLALEYAGRGIRVNGVGPGATITPINRAWVDDPVKAAMVTGHIPLNRAGTADEMAGVCAFLASDDAAYITGQTIFVDGGLTLYADFREPWSSE